MIILQGAIHIFTEQPNSVAKSIYNGLRRQMTHLLEYETIKTSTIIQYPHAVSYFCELNLSYDYIAMTYSKKKGVYLSTVTLLSSAQYVQFVGTTV